MGDRAVGVVGIGYMGPAMALRLCDADFDVTVRDIDRRARRSAPPAALATAA